jgi:hypothetical protein
MITPVWGTYYIDRWLDMCFASLRSDGNIPYLVEHCDFELAVVTTSASVAQMQESPTFNSATAGVSVRFVTMDEFLPAEGEIAYGVPLTLAYAKAILDLGEAGIGTYVILMNADLIVASGSLVSVLARIQDGYGIITSSSIRAIDRVTQQSLLSYIDKETGVLSIAPRTMMRLANEHLHSTVSGRIVNDQGPVESNYYHQIFWRISDDCIAMRAFLLQPLCFRVDHLIEKVLFPVDYGFLTEICPKGRFCVLNDSDEYLMLELQARDSESHLLQVSPRSWSLKRHLSRLATAIGRQLATWSTPEHRRSARNTIYYHTNALPLDLKERVKPFESFVDGILDRLPPPVSHVGHFQWLPAVRIYREEMARAGSSANISLLDDPRNGCP